VGFFSAPGMGVVSRVQVSGLKDTEVTVSLTKGVSTVTQEYERSDPQTSDNEDYVNDHLSLQTGQQPG
jgi:hypothetical protein